MSKRLVAAGLCAAISAVAVFAAHAQANFKTYSDPQNRFTLQHPADWPIDVISRPTDVSYGVAIGAADAECKVFATPRAESAGKPADAVARAYQTAFGPGQWKSAADGLNIWSKRGTVTSDSVDTAKFWPVHYANFTTDSGKPGYGAMFARPGLDVWIFCSSFDNTDRKATFERMFASFAGPNDASLESAAATAAAARAAEQAKADEAAAASAAQKAQPKQKEKKKTSSLRSMRGE